MDTCDAGPAETWFLVLEKKAVFTGVFTEQRDGGAHRKRHAGSPVGVPETCLAGSSGGASLVSGRGRLCLVLLRFVGLARQRGEAATTAAAAVRPGIGGHREPSHGRIGGAAATAG